MNKIKLYLKILLVPFLSFLLLPLIVSIFDILGIHINKLLLIIISSLILISTGFITGIHSSKKGFVNGLIVGFIYVIILCLLGLVLGAKFRFGTVIYYWILILSTCLGSIIGINKKKS